jgi:hypothetical protein
MELLPDWRAALRPDHCFVGERYEQEGAWLSVDGQALLCLEAHDGGLSSAGGQRTRRPSKLPDRSKELLSCQHQLVL